MSKSIKINDNMLEKRKELYELFENQTGKKAIYKGKESSYFLAWYENYIKKKSNNVKFVVRYFPFDDKMICNDYEITENKIKYSSNNDLIWKLSKDTKEHILNEITHTMLGIPYYYVQSSHKYSIPLRLCKENDKLVDYACNSFDMYSKLHADLLQKNMNKRFGRLYNKWSIYFVIYLFVFLLTALPFFSIIFTRFVLRG